MAFKIESSLLDACALAILHRGDTYGYEITQEMKKATSISESTLYPVLRRLQQNKLCFTYDQPYQGRNRRYYSITPAGKLKLDEYKELWTEYRDAIESLLLDEPEPEYEEPDASSDNISTADTDTEDDSAADMEETTDITDSVKNELMTNERGDDND